MIALTFTLVVTLAGGVVDYVRWVSARVETVQAMDASVLAGGRQLLLNKTEAEAIQAAGGESDMTMAQCATDDEHYYSADDPDALRSAFRDIALKIATLRLTQ